MVDPVVNILGQGGSVIAVKGNDLTPYALAVADKVGLDYQTKARFVAFVQKAPAFKGGTHIDYLEEWARRFDKSRLEPFFRSDNAHQAVLKKIDPEGYKQLQVYYNNQR